MKRMSIVVLLCSVTLLSNGQHLQGTLVASVTGVDRIELVKTSIEIPSWEEKTFWPIYEAYMIKGEETSSLINRTLIDLTSMDPAASETEALQYCKNLFAFRTKKLAVFKEYYAQMGSELNGIIALKFLQTEALLEMIEEAQAYDNSVWRRYRLQPNVNATNFEAAKRNIMTNSIAIPDDKKDIFWQIYERYEEDCANKLGENYDMIAQFAGPAEDYTPALAKRLGVNIISVLARENALKEEYFNLMTRELGAVSAARFIIWEDYFSLVSKMHAWADAH